MTDLRVALRETLVSLLTHALAGGPYAPYEPVVTITYRPTRQPIQLPAVTFYDTGFKADDTVPLYRRSIHIDVWTGDLDVAEAIAHQINSVLDHQPFPLPGAEGLVVFLMLQSDQDLVQNDADLVRKQLTYTAMAYEYNGPPFGEVIGTP